mgnify:FL=1
MTGQVKEELLTRRMELGVRFIQGEIYFKPILMRGDEWPEQSQENHMLQLAAGEVFFQLCSISVIYAKGPLPKIEVHTAEGVTEISGAKLPKNWSSHLFARDGVIQSLRVTLGAK